MARWRLPWHRKIGPIGLDLGAETPRAMQVCIGVNTPCQSAVARCSEDASIVERAACAVDAMRRVPFIGREVIVGLPSSFAAMHVARFPALTGHDATEAIAWDACERMALPREAIIADAIPTGAPTIAVDGKVERLVVAVAAGELAAALDLLIDAGFDPIAVEPRFASVARALSRRHRRDADVSTIRALVHVEHAGSTVLCMRGDRIAFCREIPIGGAALDAAIASRLSTSTAQAAQLRARRMAWIRAGNHGVQMGERSNADSIADEAALGATRAILDALAGEVALCLRYFGVTFRGGQPSRIVLTGPHSCEPCLAGILESTCRATVVGCEAELPLATTWGTSEANGPDADFAPWTAAFGLACRTRFALQLEDAANADATETVSSSALRTMGRAA